MQRFDNRENVVQSASSVLAQRVLSSRRERARLFGAGLFADPAYDILLFLFIKRDAGKLVSTAKVCRAANVPEATALRYIQLLAKKGYLERMDHPCDKRIINLQLTSVGYGKLNVWLSRFNYALESRVNYRERPDASSLLKYGDMPAERDVDLQRMIENAVEAAPRGDQASARLTTRYRWVTPTRRGGWSATPKAAQEAALRAGVAHKDDQGRIVLDPLTEIAARTRDIL